jgi:bifunctional UDP-N-acetylglucosamine pyrophosphorylase/glucosamine-1-phosphate N-acetyltransferase
MAKKTITSISQAVILAAGESSRFWPLNEKHKSLTKILGKPVIWYTIDALVGSGIKEVVVVESNSRLLEKELAKFKFKGVKVHFVVQEEPKGTGDALLRAKDFVKDRFVVLNAERADFAQNLKPMLAGSGQNILACSETNRPWMYGIIKADGSRVLEVVEKPEKGKEPGNLKVVGIYIFNQELLEKLSQEASHPFSLIFAINKLAQEGKVSMHKISPKETFTLKYPWDLFGVREYLFEKYLKSAKKGKLHKSVIIKGDVVISKGVIVGENTIISGPCFIGEDCEIGANNIIRGPVDLEAGCKTGSFMEIKDCIVGEGTHFHSGYCGNSIISDGCRFGAGFVSANRRIDRGNVVAIIKGEKIDTKSSYFGFVCGPRTRFGIKASTMPGVLVGSDCVIGSNTVVRDNIESKKILYTVFEQQKQDKVG